MFRTFKSIIVRNTRFQHSQALQARQITNNYITYGEEEQELEFLESKSNYSIDNCRKIIGDNIIIGCLSKVYVILILQYD